MSDATKILDEKLNPTSSEVGLYNLNADAGVHVRDDGCVEIYAGSTSILVDGQSGTVSINGQAINLAAKHLNNICPSDGFRVSSGRLNPAWLPSEAEAVGIASSALSQKRSPLIARPGALEAQILTAVPGSPVPAPVKLGTLLKPVQLFQPSKSSLSMLKTLENSLKALEV